MRSRRLARSSGGIRHSAALATWGSSRIAPSQNGCQRMPHCDNKTEMPAVTVRQVNAPMEVSCGLNLPRSPPIATSLCLPPSLSPSPTHLYQHGVALGLEVSQWAQCPHHMAGRKPEGGGTGRARCREGKVQGGQGTGRARCKEGIRGTSGPAYFGSCLELKQLMYQHNGVCTAAPPPCPLTLTRAPPPTHLEPRSHSSTRSTRRCPSSRPA